MNKKDWSVFLAAAALLIGHAVWSANRISRLESELARLEASHDVLVRSTFDFGTALLGTNSGAGPSSADWARLVLFGMRCDKRLTNALYGRRDPAVLIRSTGIDHNGVDQVSR